MAGDWIKIECTTPDKPEVYQLAEKIGGIDPDAVLGKLLRVWIWADQQTFDGNAASVTRTALDRITGVDGFADALVCCGWLTSNDGGLTFPNFDRHNGKTAKTRALTAKRVRNHRNADVTPSALLREEKRESINTPSNDGGAGSRKPRKKGQPIEYSSELTRWWEHYPKKVAKDDALKAFPKALDRIARERSLSPDGTLAWLIDRTKAYADSVKNAERKHIAHPAKWLNGGRFNDVLEDETPVVPPKHVPSIDEMAEADAKRGRDRRGR